MDTIKIDSNLEDKIREIVRDEINNMLEEEAQKAREKIFKNMRNTHDLEVKK